MLRTPAIVLVVTALAAWTARAETHRVTIVNGGGTTIRAIRIGPGAEPGPNRLRSTLPPRASAEIAYSTGCRATVTLEFDGGQTESFADQDVCGEPRIVAGQGVASHAAPRPAAVAKFQPPHVDVPWTGRSITRKFGGMN